MRIPRFYILAAAALVAANGALRGKTLELVYLEPGTSDAAAARVRLSRR